MNDYLLGILIREQQQQLLKESGRIVPEAENGPGTVERIARRLLRGFTGLKTWPATNHHLPGQVGIGVDY